MKTISLKQLINLRKLSQKSKKRLSIAFVFIFSLEMLFSCQVLQLPAEKEMPTDDVVYVTPHYEKARKGHAKELLNKKYKKELAASFEGDENLRNYIFTYLRSENPKLNAEKTTESIISASRRRGYDPVFLLAVIKTESAFNPNAIGGVGEIGLMQIRPTTAQWITKKIGIKWKGTQALKDPAYNIQVGAAYFSYLKKKLDSNSAHYINAYNMGINNLRRLPADSKISHPYYSRIMANYLGIYQDLQQIKQITLQIGPKKIAGL